MTDHLVKRLPVYVNQFKPSVYAPKPSGYRCVTASFAMALDFAYPGKHNVEQVEDAMYVKYAGPDVPTDHNGLSKTQLLEMLQAFQVGFIDMSALVTRALNGDPEPLLDEIEHQNLQDVIQIITVEDESVLKHAVTGVSLHNWASADNHGSHCFVRVGFSDSEAYGLYMEPAAPGFQQPVPIKWADIHAGKVITCVAVMPPGVVAPPAGFSYVKDVWPIPPKPAAPPVNRDAATQAILALLAACRSQENQLQQVLTTNQAMQTAVDALQKEIAIQDAPTMIMPAITLPAIVPAQAVPADAAIATDAPPAL